MQEGYLVFFLYKQNIIKNIRNYGLYKKEHRINSDLIIKKLSYLPITYNGDYNVCQNILKQLKKNINTAY